MKKLLNIVLTVSLLLLIFTGCDSSNFNKRIKWHDETFKKLVYSQLEKDIDEEISPEDLDEVRAILIISDEKVILKSYDDIFDRDEVEKYLKDVPVGKITTLEDLKNFRNLRSIVVINNHLDNIDFVKNMENLDAFIAEGCNISDISPLKGCSNLSILFMDSNNISDISVLSEFEKLPETLSLSGNKISDISALKRRNDQTSLEYVNLSYNDIEDVSAFSEYDNIPFLNLSYNNIEDISPLSNLDKKSFALLVGNPCYKDRASYEIGEFVGSILGEVADGLKEGFENAYNDK